MSQCSQKDLFAPPTAAIAGPLVLTIKGIQAPRSIAQKKAKKTAEEIEPNFHIPSFKNAKVWITKTPRGIPLEKPFLITSPEFQQWKEKAVRSLESQLLSMCQTGSDATPQVLSKLSVMCSLLPVDDSVRDLRQGAWTVDFVPQGQEGVTISLERLP